MKIITCGKWKTRYYYPLIAIILSYIIYISSYYSEVTYYYVLKNDFHLFTLILPFSFLGNLLGGGVCYLITNINERSSNGYKSKVSYDSNNLKSSIKTPLLFDNVESQYQLNICYLFLSSVLEFFTHITEVLVTYDSIDIETNMYLGAFKLIVIELFSKIFLNHSLHKHQVIPSIILIILLLLILHFREMILRQLITDDYDFYNKDYQNYFKQFAIHKFDSPYIFLFIGCYLLNQIFIASTICYDNWLISVKFCNRYKILFYKGIFGVFQSFGIEIFLFIKYKEREIYENISFENILKRLSFPWSSFSNIKRIISIFIFFIVITLYNIFIINTNNLFSPEFVGLVTIFSSFLCVITIQFFDVVIYNNIKFSIVPSAVFLIILPISLIICEVIIFRCCGCEKYTAYKIDERAKIERHLAVRGLFKNDNKDDESNTSREDDSYLSSFKSSKSIRESIKESVTYKTASNL